MTAFQMLGSSDAQACEGDACLIVPAEVADTIQAGAPLGADAQDSSDSNRA